MVLEDRIVIKSSDRLFLYIDILGFTEMLEEPEKIEKLYRKINSLSVFDHSENYECIVFSDTILIYDMRDLSDNEEEANRSIMWLCEFAQDLFYRLISTDRHFRGLLTFGDFQSKGLKNIKYFYGKALVETYSYESKIHSTELYIDNRISRKSDIFKTRKYDNKFSYVYLTQNLGQIIDSLEFGESYLAAEILDGDAHWLYAYDFVYLNNVNRNMNDLSLTGAVRSKYLNTWHLLEQEYGKVITILRGNAFDPSFVIGIDWTESLDRVKSGAGFHG